MHDDGAKRQTFGMHHDSSSFRAAAATASYYLNEVDEGGQTVFPAADGALDAAEATAPPSRRRWARALPHGRRRAPLCSWYNHDRRARARRPPSLAGARVLPGPRSWGANHWVRGS